MTGEPKGQVDAFWATQATRRPGGTRNQVAVALFQLTQRKTYGPSFDCGRSLFGAPVEKKAKDPLPTFLGRVRGPSASPDPAPTPSALFLRIALLSLYLASCDEVAVLYEGYPSWGW